MRLISFFEKHHIFYQHQYGFRHKQSTTQAVIDITSSLYDNLKNDKILSCLVMIDLKIEFDTVSHEILLKLEHYGIRGIALDLLKRFLTDRKQFVNINGINSTSKPITVGVL